MAIIACCPGFGTLVSRIQDPYKVTPAIYVDDVKMNLSIFPTQNILKAFNPSLGNAN